MLLNGVNHAAILTKDTDRLVAFYREVFEAETAEGAVVRAWSCRLHTRVALCSGDQDWMASAVVGPGVYSCWRTAVCAEGGERIGTLRTVGDAFRACGFAQ